MLGMMGICGLHGMSLYPLQSFSILPVLTSKKVSNEGLDVMGNNCHKVLFTFYDI